MRARCCLCGKYYLEHCFGVVSGTDDRQNSHLLLTTLILGNMIVNEALPVITDGVLGGGIIAVVISTALVVM